MTLGRFDTMLKTTNNSIFKGANIDVADSMYMAKIWFDEQGISFTAADLLEYAKQVNTLAARHYEGDDNGAA